MKRILFFVLLLVSVTGYGQIMQTNGTPGGYQWVASKSDSLHIIPRGSDTPNIGGTKYGKSTVGAMFYKTTDSTLWIRSANKWNQVTGTGGSGGSGISSLGQGYGVVIVNDSTYDVDSSLFISVQHFYNTIDSVINIVENSGIDSIVVNSPLAIDFTNRQIPVISYTGDTTRYFIFEAPIQANVYGDTVYVYLDSTGNGDYSIAHHSFGYYLGVFLTTAQADNIYIRYDSAIGKFVDTLYSRSGNNIDTLFSSKNGVENAFYKTYKKCDELLEGGLVSLSHDLTYDITAAIYRIGCVDYNSLSDSVILSPADPDSARIDLIVLDTNGDVVVIEGEVAENPVEPQYDPELYLLLTTVYIPAAATEPLGVTVTTVYDENLGSPTEFAATNGAGLTVNWGNTTNPYHLTKDGLVSSWTNGSNRTISFTSSTNLTSSDYSLLKMFIDLTGNMNNNSSINVRFYYNNTAVTGTITLSALQGFSKTDVGYQNITIPMPVFFSTTFNRIDIIMTGAGPGMYIDWVQLQGGISNGNTDYVTNIYRNPGSTQVYKVINGIASPAFTDSVGTSGGGSVEYVVSGTGIRVDSSARVYTVNVDTFLISTRAWRDKLADSLGAIISTKGTGTVTSLTQGYGIINSTNPITTTGTQRIDTFAISTRAWRDKLADSLGVILATKQPTGNYITALTGDVTASGPGSVAATLATVNSNVGSFTNASITVNGKGLVTAASSGTAGTSLSGTGYVKMSGTTPSYQSNTQLTADVNTFTQTLSGAVPAPVTLNGYFLKDDGTWAAASAGSSALSSITAATATNTINSTDKAQEWQWNTLAGATAFKLSSNSTTAASNAQTILEVAASGSNATATQTTYAGKFTNGHGGSTGSNIAGYFQSTNGANNYAIVVPSGGGNVGIGTVAPANTLSVVNSIASTSASLISAQNTDSTGRTNIEAKNSTTGKLIFGATSKSYTSPYGASISTEGDVNSFNIISNGDNSGNGGTAKIKFFQGGLGQVPQLTLSTSSRVGINDSTPAHVFSVTAPTGTTSIATINATGQPGAANGIQIRGKTTLANSYTQLVLENDRAALAQAGLYLGGSTIASTFFGQTITDKALLYSTGSSSTGMIIGTLTSDSLYIGTNNVTRMTIAAAGNIGVGVGSPNASLHIKAGTATANTAPLKIDAGTVLTTPEAGVIETNSNNELYYSTSTTADTRGFVNLGRYTASAVDVTATANMNTINLTVTGKTVTLPTAVGIQGRVYTIKLTASGTGTVATTSSQTIDGSTTYSLASQYKYVTVQSNNANWIVIANN